MHPRGMPLPILRRVEPSPYHLISTSGLPQAIYFTASQGISLGFPWSSISPIDLSGGFR